MASEGTGKSQPEVPHLGESGYFCIELFCGSGNLTYAMKHFFPDSFGVDHKVGKQRVKTVCLDLSVETNQRLVEQWCLSGHCLWVQEHASGGCPRSRMGHPHFEVIGGRMECHHCQASTLLESGFQIVCTLSWLV